MKKIFFWLHQGRLGNLIFQYQAILHVSGEGRVIAMGSEFFDLFEKSPRFVVLPCPKFLRRYIGRLWVVLLQWCARQNWIGTVQPGCQILFENFTGETTEIQWKPGWLSGVYVAKGFFQSPIYMEPMPRLKQECVDAAERRLAAIPKESRVAIHIRFGDYVRWPVFGVRGAACLPAKYYARAMRIIETKVHRPHYVLFSDEPEKALSLLAADCESHRFEVTKNGSTGKDFAMMASCSHAIVSASTFAWWAATLITNPDRILVAPEYWAGFQKGIWFPPGIRSNQFNYISPGDPVITN